MGTLTVDSWRGAAADAFNDRRSELQEATSRHDEGLLAVASILDGYATELAALIVTIEEARARMRDLWSRVTLLPPDFSVLRDLAETQRDLREAVFLKARLGQRTADNLYARIHGSQTSLTGFTWPPAGWPVEALWSSTPLSGTILDDSSFDPADVAQGGIGDCYLLSALMTLMGTAEGDALLRENLRWDPDLQGYWVTLYVDGSPTPFFVDRAITNGAVEGGVPGVVTLYESAMREYLTYADLHDGGVAADVYPLITGADAFQRRAADGGWDYDVLREDRANGGYMVASASPVDSSNAPEVITIQRPTPYGTVYPDQVTITGPHAYAVVSVTDDGVWLMNPHGTDNRLDGGGRFLVSPADFDRLFWRMSVGEVGG